MPLKRIFPKEKSLISDIFGIEGFSVRKTLSGDETTVTGLYGEIYDKFEEYRGKNPVARNVIGGVDTFSELVTKYTRPKGKTLYPHLQNIDGDEVKYLKECVGDFPAGNFSDLTLNPPSMAVLGSLFSAILGNGISGIKQIDNPKIISRRKFIKAMSAGGGTVGASLGFFGSGFKLLEYIDAEWSAEFLDKLKEKVY